MRENLYSARVSMWAVLSAVVLALTSSDLLLTGRELSLSDHRGVLYTVTSLAMGLGLLIASVLAADPVAGQKEWATLEGMLLIPTKKRRALLLGKVLGVVAAWLIIFAVSAPYILVAGFGTSVLWAALIYTFVLGTLCVVGFAALIVGIGALSRSGRGGMLVSLAIVVAMVAPTLLGTTLQESWFGDTYKALSPVAQAKVSLGSMIVDKESLLVQLPHIGAMVAFAVSAGVFAAFTAAGPHWKEVSGMKGAEISVPAERIDSRPADPEERVRL